MKKGFTLAELLIALGIVGVVAALAAPAIRGFMPDKTKASYIKTYNVLANKVNEVTSDTELYWHDASSLCKGIGCTDRPSEISATGYAPSKKLPTLIYNRINAAGGITFNNKESKFRTTDGTVWTFDVSNDAPGTYEHSLSIDFNGGNGCEYNIFTCKKPTKFTFVIENSGNVVASDSMGIAYLRNALDLRHTDTDKTLARRLELRAAVDYKDKYQEAQLTQMADELKELYLNETK